MMNRIFSILLVSVILLMAVFIGGLVLIDYFLDCLIDAEGDNA